MIPDTLHDSMDYSENWSPLLYFSLNLCFFSCLLQVPNVSYVWHILLLMYFKARRMYLFTDAHYSVLRAL